MSDDDFFDDLDWTDAVIGGSFIDYMTEEEKREENLRRKYEQDPDYDPALDDEEPYL